MRGVRHVLEVDRVRSPFGHQEIAVRQKELDGIIGKLEAAGLKAGAAGRHEELVDAARDGTLSEGLKGFSL